MTSFMLVKVDEPNEFGYGRQRKQNVDEASLTKQGCFVYVARFGASGLPHSEETHECNADEEEKHPEPPARTHRLGGQFDL